MRLSVCVYSVRQDNPGTTRAIFNKFLCMLPLHVRGWILLRHVNERPHRLSPARGTGVRSQRRRSVPYLWPPHVIGQAIYIFMLWFLLLMVALCNYIFALWFLSIYLSFFIPRLISAATDWMSTILLHMAWP